MGRKKEHGIAFAHKLKRAHIFMSALKELSGYCHENK
jgi:hypothetical protein